MSVVAAGFPVRSARISTVDDSGQCILGSTSASAMPPGLLLAYERGDRAERTRQPPS